MKFTRVMLFLPKDNHLMSWRSIETIMIEEKLYFGEKIRRKKFDIFLLTVSFVLYVAKMFCHSELYEKRKTTTCRFAL